MEQASQKRKVESSTCDDDGQATPPNKKSRRILCKFCEKAFNKEQVYFDHINKNHKDCLDVTWVKCAVCQSSYPDDNSLSDHMARKHSQESNDCKSGKEANETWENLQKEQNAEKKSLKPATEKSSSKLQCPFCPIIFSDEEIFQNHLKLQHDELRKAKMFQCIGCDFYLSDSAALSAHTKSKHENLNLSNLFNLENDSNQGDAQSIDNGTTPKVESGEENTSGEDFEQIAGPEDHDSASFDSRHEAVRDSTRSELDSDDGNRTSALQNVLVAEYTPSRSSSPPMTQQSTAIKAPRSILCPVCKKSQRNGNKYHCHVTTLHPEFAHTEWIRCPNCPMFLPDSAALTKHSQFHIHEAVRADCMFCEKNYSRQSDLVVHVNKVHKVTALESNWIKCPECDWVLQNEITQKRHTRKAHKWMHARSDENGDEAGDISSVTEKHNDSEVKTEPELEDANGSDESSKEQSSRQVESPDRGNSGSDPEIYVSVSYGSGNGNVNDNFSDTGNESASISSDVAMENEESEEDIEEISLVHSDEEDTAVVKRQYPISLPRSNREGNVLPLKEYVHNGVFASRNYIETEDAIIMKMDYKSGNIYFPNIGPYRCEMCLVIIETNRSFFEHVYQKHFSEVDKTTIRLMEESLNATDL